MRRSFRTALVVIGLFIPGVVPSALFAQATPQEVLHVWPGAVPGSMGIAPADVPVVEVYLPERNPTHTAVLVCPGGGYSKLALDHEGPNIAAWLVSHQVAAFVLHYRVAPYKYPYPLLDAERAMRLVRSRSAQDGIDADHIGVWGFSAGGHVASHLAVAFDGGKPTSEQADAVDAVSDPPDFAILSYPVISMKPGITHPGSHNSLLGVDADPEQEQAQSNDLHVRPDSPPLFLVAANDDTVVPVQNSLLMYQAYRAQHLSVDMHLFATGGHGFALGARKPEVAVWPLVLSAWMIEHDWMSASLE
jgi:acetyl esterase/lipase